MEEKMYKIYDSMYNVIGVSSYEEVHTQGLLHQVVHFWLLEKGEKGNWLYVQKRADEDPVYKGAYDILTSGHIDPEETHEEAVLHQIKKQLGLEFEKDQLNHIGNIEQKIDRDNYHDYAIVQSYFCEIDHPEKQFSGAERVVKVKYEDVAGFPKKDNDKLLIYSVDGEQIGYSDAGQWWNRNEEFNKLVYPYIKKHLEI